MTGRANTIQLTYNIEITVVVENYIHWADNIIVASMKRIRLNGENLYITVKL